jgi:hypothetical protein
MRRWVAVIRAESAYCLRIESILAQCEPDNAKRRIRRKAESSRHDLWDVPAFFRPTMIYNGRHGPGVCQPRSPDRAKPRVIKLPKPERVPLPRSSRVALATLHLSAAIFMLLFVWQHRVYLIH